MKAEVKKKWVAALKSGKYDQTTGLLVYIMGGTPRSYCCLGVLRKCVTGRDRYNSAAADTVLSSKFMSRIGMTAEDATDLIELNDNGMSFPNIAKWIEINL